MGFELKVLGRQILSVNKSAPTTMAMGGYQSAGIGTINPATFRGLDILNNSIFYPEYTSRQDFTKAFLKCPPIGTIIARKSSAFSEGIITAKDWNTGDPLKDPKWQELIQKPNPFQTEDQFKTQLYTYFSIYGFALAFKDPEGVGTSWSIKSLWALPMQHIDVTWRKGNYMQMDAKDLIERISMTVNGVTTVIDKDNVSLFTYKGPSVSDSMNFSSPIVPQSPLVGIERPVENVILAYEASGSMIKDRGALGVFSNKGMDAAGVYPLDSSDKEELHQAWSRYGILPGQRKAIITNANVDWLQIGMRVKDLMLHKEIQTSSCDIADRYGYPSHLLSFGKAATFNNMEIADKRTFTNAIIPEGVHFTEQLNTFLETESNGFYYEIDFSHVDALQEDKKFAAEARKQLNEALKIEYENNQITKNEWRIKNGEEEVSGWDLYKYQFDAMIGASNNNENQNNVNEET